MQNIQGICEKEITLDLGCFVIQVCLPFLNAMGSSEAEISGEEVDKARDMFETCVVDFGRRWKTFTIDGFSGGGLAGETETGDPSDTSELKGISTLAHALDR